MKIVKTLTQEGPDPGDPEAKWVDLEELKAQEGPGAAASYLAECIHSLLVEGEPAPQEIRDEE
ncbi:MAG: hypothetical protein QME76_02060 [Bacillota bacterium]|nr:hypothetical protein [Bacillota bacterium]